ncbi:hypothetical protein NCLIV_023890 [Neospora caninum Liverpool]|uniref:TRUD domain-containing protein n=1 Tax=Neospora caninum (strain Liverpool) TaxID=572307 RepID=F0VFV6_NEOCL|nr:hypothetical protein NCLIV_023890 [Neospora caninum Liverpool]CBZ52600.1 hypothetical protein NCLIV_023890 [Neospora caninum Liverpool]CEL66578.1 TPA: hypothetical protein BN1204_023890 [Neospora caninum Liverpool]|eukprot:XP_003882632.1 hypothetical protein NCLIV_023890 [Neospora caninum Liverpool]
MDADQPHVSSSPFFPSPSSGARPPFVGSARSSSPGSGPGPKRDDKQVSERAMLSLSDFSRRVGISQFVASRVSFSGNEVAETQDARQLSCVAVDGETEGQTAEREADDLGRDAGDDQGGFWGSLKTLYEDFQVYEHSEWDCTCLREQRECSRCMPSLPRGKPLSSPSSTSSDSFLPSSGCASVSRSDDCQRDPSPPSNAETCKSLKDRANLTEGNPQLREPCAFGCWCRAFGDNPETAPLRLPFLVDPSKLRRQREEHELSEAGSLQIASSFRLWRTEAQREAERARRGGNAEPRGEEETGGERADGTEQAGEARNVKRRRANASAAHAPAADEKGSQDEENSGIDTKGDAPERNENEVGRQGTLSCVSEFEVQNIEAFVRGLAWCSEVYRHHVANLPKGLEASGAHLGEGRPQDSLREGKKGDNEDDFWLRRATRTAAEAEKAAHVCSSSPPPVPAFVVSPADSQRPVNAEKQILSQYDPSKAPCLWILGDLAGLLRAQCELRSAAASSPEQRDNASPRSPCSSPSAVLPSLAELRKELRGALHAFVRDRLPFLVSESATLFSAKAAAGGRPGDEGNARRGVKRGREDNPLDDGSSDEQTGAEGNGESEQENERGQDERKNEVGENKKSTNTSREELSALQGLPPTNLSLQIAFISRVVAAKETGLGQSISPVKADAEAETKTVKADRDANILGGNAHEDGHGNENAHGDQKQIGYGASRNGPCESLAASTRFPFISLGACWAQQRREILQLKKEIEEECVRRRSLEGNERAPALRMATENRHLISLLEEAATEPPGVAVKLTPKPECRRFLFPPVLFRCTDTASRQPDVSGAAPATSASLGGARKDGVQRGGMGRNSDVCIQAGVSREERRKCRKEIEALLFRSPCGQQSCHETEEFDKKKAELFARLASHPALLDILFDPCRASGGTNNYVSASSGARWPADLGMYLHFILLKVNRDTSNALHNIGRGLRRYFQRSLAVAGTKDKRGITVQRCSVHKVSAPALLNACYLDHPSWDSNVYIAPLGHYSRPQRLGALLGNSFQVILRNVRLPSSATHACLPSNTLSLPSSFPSASRRAVVPPGFVPIVCCGPAVHVLASRVAAGMETISSRGFLNYFGLQRFGTHAVRTFEVGAALLQGDWKEAVARILGKRQTASSTWQSAAASTGETSFACSTDTSRPFAEKKNGSSVSDACGGVEIGGADAKGEEGIAGCGAETEREEQGAADEGVRGKETDAGQGKVGNGFQDAHHLDEQGKKEGGAELSLWDVLQKTGDPRVVLGRLARHQHLERALLSSLLKSQRRGESVAARGEGGSKQWREEGRANERKRGMPRRDGNRREDGPLGSAAGTHAEDTDVEGREMQAQREEAEGERGQGDTTVNGQNEDMQRDTTTNAKRDQGFTRDSVAVFEVEDYFRALQEIPADSLQLYVHSAQSVIFNHACTWRWKALGDKVCVGDVVRVRSRGSSSATPSAGSTLSASFSGCENGEACPTPDPEGVGGRFFFDEEPGETGGEDGEEHGHQTVKVIETEAEAQQASIFDLVLPLPGADIVYPSQMMAVYRQLASGLLGVSLDAFTTPKDDVCLDACGSCPNPREGDRSRSGRGGRKGDRGGKQRSRFGACRGRGRGRGDTRRGTRDCGEPVCGNEDGGGDRTSPVVLSPSVGLSILGIKCKGSYRPLLERARDCQWQLLQLRAEAVHTPASLLLSDVDLLLRQRQTAPRRSSEKASAARGVKQGSECAKSELVGEAATTHRKPGKDQSVEIGDARCEARRPNEEQDFRVSWDEPLDSTLVRCMYPRYDQVQMEEQAGARLQGQQAAAVASRTDGEIIVKDGKSNFCLLLRLRLPPGTYFTMALRELMRANAPDDDELAHTAARTVVTPEVSGKDTFISAPCPSA